VRREANKRYASRDVTVWRLLDANANRAREGLRVIEDSARFVLNQPKTAKALRDLRHGVDKLVRLHYAELLLHRDVGHDPGRFNPAKAYRGDLSSLLAANFKRAEEAVRVLEEYGRMLSPRAVKKAKEIRFQIYQWEKKLLQSQPPPLKKGDRGGFRT